MAKRQLKNWSLIFAAIFALLIAPIASAACACATHDGAKSDEHSSQQVAENDCHSAAHETQTEETAQTDFETTSITDDCCCLKNPTRRLAIGEKKFVQTDNFNAQVAQERFEFFPTIQVKLIRFYRTEIIRPARCSLSDKPARAPPSL
jgi:hypothetical protein